MRRCRLAVSVGPHCIGYDTHGNDATAGDFLVWSSSLPKFQRFIAEHNIFAIHGIQVVYNREARGELSEKLLARLRAHRAGWD